MKKLTFEQVKSYIESFNYQLLSTEYINNTTKLQMKCPEGHEFEMSYNAFQNNQRCPICYRTNYIPHNKLTYKVVKNYIESFKGYKLLSKKYKNSQDKLEIQCPLGHKFHMSYNVFKRNHRCPFCAFKRRGELSKNKFEDVKNYIESFGYTMVSNEYINAHHKIEIQCPFGHKFYIIYNSFQQGRRCPICSYYSLSSKAEKEIQEYCKSIYSGKIINNDRSVITNPLTNKNLELDIYFPWSKRAIEYDGDYWHSFEYQKNKDEIKKDQCKKLGINLLVIKEQDWIDNKEKCLNEIKNFILG